MMLFINSNYHLQSSLLIFVAIILCNNQATFAGPISEGKFLKWLDGLTGRTNEGEYFLDWINIDIGKYSETSSFDRRIPDKLKKISSFKGGFCNGSLKETLDYSPVKGPNNYDAQYFKFFANLKFNICAQDMELRRIKAAAKSMDKFKWSAFYSAFGSNNGQKNGKIDMQVAAEKLANHLKRYVPQSESSADKQIEFVGSQIKEIFKEVCPYVLKDMFLSPTLDAQQIQYLDKNREAFKIDAVPEMWSRSIPICSDKTEQNNLISSVVKILGTQLDSIKIEDKNLAEISDAKVLKDYLFSNSAKLPESGTIRMGKPVEVLEKFNQITSDKNDKQLSKKLLELDDVNAENYACEDRAYERREDFEKKYANTNLESFIKSTNALQFHLCDMILRNKAANLPSKLPAVQFGRLEELRHLFDRKKLTQFDRTNILINPENGFGKCIVDYIDRYYPLKKDYKNKSKNAKNIVKIVDMFDVGNYREHQIKADQITLDLVKGIKEYYKKTMETACANYLNELTKSDVERMQQSLQSRQADSMGPTEARLFDYAILCNFYSDFKSLRALFESLGDGNNKLAF